MTDSLCQQQRYFCWQLCLLSIGMCRIFKILKVCILRHLKLGTYVRTVILLRGSHIVHAKSVINQFSANVRKKLGIHLSMQSAMAYWICFCALVYTVHHAAANRLSLPDAPAVSPSKWAKAEHMARLLLSHIYIWFGQGKWTTIFWQGEANCVTQSQIQCVLKCIPSWTQCE